MIRSFRVIALILIVFRGSLWAHKASAPVTDPLNRINPRSSVTAFLQACRNDNYTRAAEYLDLKQLPENKRSAEGIRLSQQLESILNSDGHFDVLQLSQSPEGNLSDDTNPALEHVSSISGNGQTYSIQLERAELTQGSPVWIFAPSTVADIPAMIPNTTQSALEARLPGFLVSIRILETPLWKWVVLIALAVFVFLLFGIARRLLPFAVGLFGFRAERLGRWAWIESVLQPWLVFLCAMLFGVAEQFIDPSAISRLYLGRAILLVVVCAFAWCLINLIDLFLLRIESLLEPRQRVVSHSLIFMGKRAAKVAIVFVAAIIVLDNWGYNMTTMIAGLGVGGIAIALAAQGTIANVFGGVSVIGDHPVMVGDFGNFGGVLGTVEDIGMRSTRVRTLNRTMMSIPNSSFAGMNLENYALRDKILFNPTFQIKRSTPKENILNAMKALSDLLRGDERFEVGPSPVRLNAMTAASFAMEIFAYTLTSDIDEFYKIEADLFLKINDLLTSSGVELA